MEEVFNFEEFIKGKSDVTDESKSIESNETVTDLESDFLVEEDVDISEEKIIESVSTEEDNYYRLYKDKSEEFVCDVFIEGANADETEARIVIESQDWTLMFKGHLQNGKCVVPIKRLSILPEGQIGKIRLEIIAEGNLFIPWEEEFKVKLSKKVTVKVNEQNSKIDNGIKVRAVKNT